MTDKSGTADIERVLINKVMLALRVTNDLDRRLLEEASAKGRDARCCVHTSGVPAMKDYAVVSKHEKGFWQIDVYWKLEQPPEESDSPDHFKTLKVGDPKERAIEWCGQWCPHAEVLIDDDCGRIAQ